MFVIVFVKVRKDPYVLRARSQHEHEPRKRPAPPALDLSRASEAYRYLAAFDDNGNLAPVVGISQHTAQPFFIFEDIDVVEGDLAPGVFRTGSRSIGSEILPEDQNLVRCHR